VPYVGHRLPRARTDDQWQAVLSLVPELYPFSRMTQPTHAGWMVLAAAVGATAMCLLDPTSGKRRRARVADRARRLGRKTVDASGATARDVRNRMAGLAARASRLTRRGEPVSDAIVTERVRAALGREVSHPRAVDVETVNGCVCLSGPILREEADRVLEAALDVSGVQEVVDLLDRHDAPGDVPALQGGATRTGPEAGWRQARWSPAMRLLAGASAIAMTAGILAGRRS